MHTQVVQDITELLNIADGVLEVRALLEVRQYTDQCVLWAHIV